MSTFEHISLSDRRGAYSAEQYAAVAGVDARSGKPLDFARQVRNAEQAKSEAELPAYYKSLRKPIQPALVEVVEKVEDENRVVAKSVVDVMSKVSNETVSVEDLASLQGRANKDLPFQLQVLTDTVRKIIAALAGTGCFSWLRKWWYSRSFKEPLKAAEAAQAILVKTESFHSIRQKLILDGVEKMWNKALADLNSLKGKIEDCAARILQAGDPVPLQEELRGYQQQAGEIATLRGRLLEHLSLGRFGNGEHEDRRRDLEARIQDEPTFHEQTHFMNTVCAKVHRQVEIFKDLQQGNLSNISLVRMEDRILEPQGNMIYDEDLARLDGTNFDFAPCIASIDTRLNAHSESRGFVERLRLLNEKIPRVNSAPIQQALNALAQVREQERQELDLMEKAIIAAQTARQQNKPKPTRVVPHVRAPEPSEAQVAAKVEQAEQIWKSALEKAHQRLDICKQELDAAVAAFEKIPSSEFLHRGMLRDTVAKKMRKVYRFPQELQALQTSLEQGLRAQGAEIQLQGYGAVLLHMTRISCDPRYVAALQ